MLATQVARAYRATWQWYWLLDAKPGQSQEKQVVDTRTNTSVYGRFSQKAASYFVRPAACLNQCSLCCHKEHLHYIKAWSLGAKEYCCCWYVKRQQGNEVVWVANLRYAWSDGLKCDFKVIAIQRQCKRMRHHLSAVHVVEWKLVPSLWTSRIPSCTHLDAKPLQSSRLY